MKKIIDELGVDQTAFDEPGQDHCAALQVHLDFFWNNL